MPRWNPQQLSSNLVRRKAEGDMAFQDAQRQKVMQEVFDLSVDNEMQRTQAREFMQPDRAKTRTAQDTAERAKADAITSKSMMLMRDDQHEMAETAFAAYNSNPSAESYSTVKEMLTKANPHLAGELPEKYSKEAGNTMTRIQRAWLNNKQFRQKMEGQGFDRRTQQILAQDKFKHDASMLEADYKAKFQLAAVNHNMMLDRLGMELTSTERRSLWSASPFVQKAEEYKNANDYESASAMLDLAVQAAQLEIQAKARAGTDPSLIAQRKVDTRNKLRDNVREMQEGDYANIKGGWDKRTKSFKVTGGAGVRDELLNSASNYNIDSDKRAGWVNARMVMHPAGKKWLKLPLNEQGLPPGRITSQDILKSIGQQDDSGRRISNLNEALVLYDEKLKREHGIHNWLSQAGD